MTAFTWTIVQLERETENGGVIVAHWQAEAVDGEHTARGYGSCSFAPNAADPGFIPFDNLTEADVLAWVYEEVDKEQTESSLQLKIDKKKTPTTITGVPWQ